MTLVLWDKWTLEKISSPENVRPDLDPNCLTLMVFLKESADDKKACRVSQ